MMGAILRYFLDAEMREALFASHHDQQDTLLAAKDAEIAELRALLRRTSMSDPPAPRARKEPGPFKCPTCEDNLANFNHAYSVYIAALTAENAELRAALEFFLDHGPLEDYNVAEEAITRAVAALAPKVSHDGPRAPAVRDMRAVSHGRRSMDS